MNRLGWRVLATGVAALFVTLGCGNSGGGGGELAADQTLRYPMNNDVEYLDPGQVEFGTDITFTNEMFSGLYKVDNSGKEVNDIATGPPDVSSDGKTYTFKLRHDAKFWNGDPITAKDFVYSWNRLAYLNGAYASCADPIVGSQDVENQKAKTMTGLTAPDDYTIKAQLSDTAGYWLTEVGLWCMQVVDQKVIGDYTDASNKKNDDWWKDPSTAVGSGPFKMTQRTPKASLAFEAVPNWWGGSTGAIKKVEVTIGEDAVSAIKKFESGGYDVVGPSNYVAAPDDVIRYKNDATKKKLLTLYPAARTTWISFNMTKGPFQSKAGGVTPGSPTNGPGVDDQGKAGRHALSIAINRDQLVDVACAQGALCAKATGGWISKGLKGYLGDNSDPNVKFDAAAAKAEYAKWDPDKSKAAQMKYTYNSGSAVSKAVAENLQSQWKANLGIDVQLQGVDKNTMSSLRKGLTQWVMGYGSWGADYDHPQDWFDNMLVCSQAKVGRGSQGSGYCNPALDQLVTKADAKQLEPALPDYQQAGKMLNDDMVVANLYYGVVPYFVQKYVSGAGYTSLFDYRWEGIKILKH